MKELLIAILPILTPTLVLGTCDPNSPATAIARDREKNALIALLNEANASRDSCIAALGAPSCQDRITAAEELKKKAAAQIAKTNAQWCAEQDASEAKRRADERAAAAARRKAEVARRDAFCSAIRKLNQWNKCVTPEMSSWSSDDIAAKCGQEPPTPSWAGGEYPDEAECLKGEAK